MEPHVQIREVNMALLAPLIQEMIDKGKNIEINVTGTSMLPMLYDRKSIVRLAAPDNLRIGDIPLYQRDNGKYILHRIIAIRNGSYICCGDHQWHPEHGISKDQIIAVVTDFNRKGKWCSRTDWRYGIYWRCWVWIRPLRRLVFGGWRRVCRYLTRK